MNTVSDSISHTATAVGILFQLADGSIQSCNRDAERILGYSAEEMIGVAASNLAIAFGNSKSVVTALETGEPCSDLEMEFYQPDGSLVWLSLTSQPLFSGSSDRPSGVVTTFKDITAAKRDLEPADSQKLESSKDFKLFADAIPGILYIFDAISQRNLYINSQAYDSLGYTPKHILEMGQEFRTKVMHPDDLALFPVHLDRLERSQPGEVCKLEYRMRHQNGEWRWFCTQERVYSRTQDGKLERILGIARDITNRQQAQTALKESEERLKLATVASGMGMWFWDLVADTLEWTEQCKAIFGLPADAELSYEKFISILHPDDRDRARKANAQALTNLTEYRLEYRAIWSDGSVHWIAARGRGFYNQAGKPVRMMGTVQDISDRKQIEAQLRDSEQHLKRVLNSLYTFVGVLTPNGILIEANRPALDAANLQAEDVLGKPFAQTYWWSYSTQSQAQLNEAIQRAAAGEAVRYDVQVRLGAEHYILIDFSLIPLFDHNGKVEYLIPSGIDITERKQAEKALKNSEQQLRKVLDSLPVYVGLLTPQGKVVTINQTALAGIDTQLEDVLGKTFAQTPWWTFSAEIQAKINDGIKRAAAGENVRFDTFGRGGGKDNLILVDFNIIPVFNEDGQVEYLIPSGVDISDREASKQALMQREQELKLITEVIPQQIWTASANGEVDYFNQRWLDYTGIPLEETVNNGWSINLHPEDSARVIETWAESVISGKKYNIEARLRGADGVYRWFLTKARPLRNQQGKIIRWYGTNTSITRIKELEQRLRQQTEDLIRANQLKDEFMAIVSHELRTPLNPILGWSQLLAAGRLDPEKTAAGISIIERNAKLQAQLIDDLLDVSRILRGKLNLNQTPLSLEMVIKSALTTVQLAAEAKSIQIKTELEPKIGQVAGDAGRLQQIIWNLVSNAIKFTPEGGQVLVKLGKIGTQALIQVQDTGQGIDSEFLPYVFDRFRQAEGGNTRQFGGLGLGLAIVRHLSELHGGTVAVASEGKGKGANFSVKLPLMNIPIAEPIDINPIEPSVQPNRFSGIKILVVDDEVDSLDILTLVLEQEGAEVISVASAAAGLEVLNESTPDLIVSDIGMPKTDGYTLMSQIRNLSEGKNIPAIALTAYAGEVNQQLSLEAGFNRHLAKPINIPELIAAITELVQ